MSEKRCLGCRYYHAYYTKGICRFERFDYGFCEKSREMLQDRYGTCKKWSSNRVNSKRQLAIAPAILENAANAILELKQIVCGAREENAQEIFSK